MKIAHEVNYDYAAILLDGTVHLLFKARDVLGFQSWQAVGYFALELTFKHGTRIKLEYEQRELWEAVVKRVYQVLRDGGES